MTSRPSINRSNSSCSGLTSRGHVQSLPRTEQATLEAPAQSVAAQSAGGDYEACDVNRTVKRQKIDQSVDASNTLRGSKPRLSQAVSALVASEEPPAPVQAGRPPWSFQDEIGSISSQQRLEQPESPSDEPRLSASCPTLPVRPWRRRHQDDSAQETAPYTDETANNEVQTTPYCAQVPEAAPKYESDSRSLQLGSLLT